MKMLRSNKKSLIALVILSVLAVGAGTLAVTLSRDFAIAASTTPEPFTELYFNNTPSLPPVITAGETVRLSFSVANHEGATKSYPYRITLFENGKPRTLVSKQVVLIDNQKATLPVTFSTSQPGTNLQLVIDLPDQDQSIHFRSRS